MSEVTRVRYRNFVAALVCVGGCHPGFQGPATNLASLPLDHVILAIDSLDRGIDLLRNATGVTPIMGGVHPGRGTQNALLALGGGRYLELLAPNPNDTTLAARQNAARQAAYFAQFRTLTPVGWAVHVRDIGAERVRLLVAGIPPGPIRPGSRATGDGRTLRWQTLEPWGRERAVMPFVIAWDSASRHPSTTAPGGCVLADLRIVTPAADSLRGALGRAGWRVAVAGGRPEHLEIDLTCPSGRTHFP